MIAQFIQTCEKNGENTAFIIGNKRICFRQLLSDVYRMTNLFMAQGLKKGDKALVYFFPSYDFYVLLFACIYYGVNIVTPDSYKDKNRLLQVMQEEKVACVFCNHFTRYLKGIFPKETSCINVEKYHQYSDEKLPMNDTENAIILTTFTSGTTGDPKPIYRSLAFLKKQMQSISKNIDIADSKVVFGGLPIYVLYAVYNGRTCVIDRRLCAKQLQKQGVDTIFAPIALLLKSKGDFSLIRHVYFGGARLYKRQAEQLKTQFPKAKIQYNYGASECALMGMTDLDYYLKNGFAIKNFAQDIALFLTEQDEKGIGRICVKGECVLTEDKEYHSNDLGYIDDRGLHIVGRKKYSGGGAYNYLLDDEILEKNDEVVKGFSFVYQGNTYFCYEGKITHKKDAVVYVKFTKLPMDAKHKTKLDYHKTIEILEKKKKV